MPAGRMIFFAYRGLAFAASIASVFVLCIAPHRPGTSWIGLGLTALSLLAVALASWAKARLK